VTLARFAFALDHPAAPFVQCRVDQHIRARRHEQIDAVAQSDRIHRMNH
jgi:hypothetical protein